MTDYYVDAAAAGTGDGLTAVNAFVSIQSVPWANADRAWLRRSHLETLTASQWVGPSSWALLAFSRYAHVIGWPDVNDPFYTERPADGVTAGWDSDVPGTAAYSLYGYKFPTLSTSNGGSTGVFMGSHVGYANLSLVNCGGAGTEVFWKGGDSYTSGTGTQRIFNNILPQGPTGPLSQLKNAEVAIHEHLILVGSTAGSFFPSMQAKRLDIHSTSMIAGLWGSTSAIKFFVDHLVNYSNSVTNVVKQTLADYGDAGVGLVSSIRKASGVAPYSGAMVTGLARQSYLRCDDYFGEGPLVIGDPQRKMWFGMASSGGAMHNGSRVMMHRCNSEQASFQDYAGQLRLNYPIVQKRFDVLSGTMIEIRVPIFHDNLAVFSLAGGFVHAHLLAYDCKPVVAVASNVLPGTPSLWSGSLTTAGSAWLFSAVYTPTETGEATFECFVGPFIQATSGQGITGTVLFSEPYKV